jgi:[acyl-carrier-protein] S-malonyltransferase
MLVAPAKGAFKFRATHLVGDTVPAGEVVGVVETLRETIDVAAPHGGVVVEWLVHDGDPVSPGQPLVRLHPVAQEAAV